MSIDEIKKRAIDVHNNMAYHSRGCVWAADTILQLCAEVERLGAEIEIWSRASKRKINEIEKLTAANKDAVKTINQMQNIVKMWTNPNNLLGQEMLKAFNIGAKFNSDNPELFNQYLAEADEAMNG